MITRHVQSKINHRAVEHNGVIYLGGMVADDKTLDARGQAGQACAKIEKLLLDLGSSKEKLLTATVYLADFSTKQQMNEAWCAWLSPDIFPTRTCVGAVLEKGTLVEITVSAAK
ncbi:RidA family protein [Radicibacter daui]|uniref:RidA family protein n=1 Tax=Radicibacter daui TaxID=3064829 RepID=UPI004046E250